MKIGTIVSKVQRDVVEVQQILTSRENNDGQNQGVSNPNPPAPSNKQ